MKTFALACLVSVTFLFCTAPALVAQEDPTFGTWALATSAPGSMLAVHSTLLRTNKILVIAGSSYNCCFAWGHEEARFYDIATNTWSAKLASPSPYGSTMDAFCSGHAHDDTGAVVFQGGLLGYGNLNGHGIPNSARFDPNTGTFTPLTGAIDHWYPTVLAGADSLFNFPGRNTQFSNPTADGDHIQRLVYGTNAWTSTGVSMWTKGTYPRVSLLPNGKLFVASPGDVDRKNFLFDPATSAVLPAGTDVVPESEPSQVHCCDSWQGSGALLPLVPSGGGYPQARFALTNGVNAYVKDLGAATPTWQTMGTRPTQLGTPSPQRWFANATFLPTGQLVVTGGVLATEHDSDSVRKAEVYDPETNNWLLTSEATVPRNYHGVALLLPDGRIWTASSSMNHSGSQCGVSCTGGDNTEVRVEIFTPWYVGRPDRPVVTGCPASIFPDGSAFNVGIGASGGPKIGRVLLLRAGSVTHSYDSDQRVIQLELTGSSASSVTVKGPYGSGAAPPGDYMIFALLQISSSGFKRWVPSTACWTHVASQPRKIEGAPIWRYTNITCTGSSCPGWEKLDNNPKTMFIAAGGTHHDQFLYQLHNNGAIWQFSGKACTDSACPGWMKLDNNPAAIAIASAGSQLYQLHNDGSIWRYLGSACTGDSCPGWQKLDNNPTTAAIAAASNQLFQLHVDGSIWRYLGPQCTGSSCPGWQRLDHNSKTTAIVGAEDQLYQLHNDGRIWRFTGAPCAGDLCPGWQMLDNNTATVALTAADSQLYQTHNDGSIWRYLGTPCVGETCSGWIRLDNNSRTVALTATGSTSLYQIHNDGQIWTSTGPACSGDSCPGWVMIDNNVHSSAIAAGDPPTMGSSDPLYQLQSDPLYQLHDTGAIWRYIGLECAGPSCPGWERLDNNAGTTQIAAAGRQIFQRHTDGAIWRYTGTPCTGDSCPGWQQLDNNAQTVNIAAGGTQLYQLHKDGGIWRSTGTPCSGPSCPGWEQLDNNAQTTSIAATQGAFFQLHTGGGIWRYTGTPCSGASCTGWQQLDNNPLTKSITAAGNQLFQLHAGTGDIWRYTGTPCSGALCGGWQRLDNNPATVAIAGGGNQLYQLHNDGRIFRYTGTPCSAASCPGWELLDNNANTKEIIATGNRLYQRHSDGGIWRYSGTPCSGTSCPGWVQLDNNPKGKALAVGGAN